ncbi:hypothetical protein E4U03_07590 [Rothia nasimurium]|uniref:Uncharacterized protein n=1 Tax=Rothia nasimurium TaxID=85336 RepID=A0A4Y9F3Z9_9MICC|nr:hypothetical protein [Rothia nasimurium]MBF0808471.1 hypothetical protein [Rothia nasimurium]TFU21963.1 hypothetical protein E4U03_07590 [Rothia nasimurium]
MGLFKKKPATYLIQDDEDLIYLEEAKTPSLAERLRQGAIGLQEGLEREVKEESLLGRAAEWAEAGKSGASLRLTLVALAGILCIALLCILVLLLTGFLAVDAGTAALGISADEAVGRYQPLIVESAPGGKYS